MKQKIFIILIGLLGISNLIAQPFKAPVERNPQAKFKASPFKFSGQPLRAATAGSLYFGYCDENASPYGVGAGSVAEISAAICMPASISELYAGKTITTIRIGLTANCTNVSVWIRSSLSGANLVSKTVGNASAGWMEVTLSTPFTITASDLYIGYTATGFTQIGFSGSADNNACWLYSDQVDSQWDNVAGNGFGSLCIQAQIDVKGATILAVKPESLPKSIQGIPNQNISVPCSIKNYSSVDITSVKVSYQINNQTPVEQTIQTSIAPMKSGSINILVKAIAVNGLYNLSVKIPEVNGQSNTFANELLNTQIRVLSHSFSKKVVIEEGTGTWCGWCVRGAVGMAQMKQKYPDKFIGIAVHDSDPMTLTAYDNYMTSNFINGFPCAVADRKSDLIGDPFYDAPNFFQSEMAQAPIAGIQLTGGFTDATMKSISLKTVTTFGISSNNANFKLAYVLIEDGVTGYDQTNYYAGGGAGAMGGYENKPNPVKDMVFNDVARGIYSDPTGISGSIPASVTEMTPVENTYTINLPSSIQNKDQLAVAVMLINSATGEIENADIIGVAIIGSNIPVTGVSLTQTTATLFTSTSLLLATTVSPANATNKKVTWSSSNQTVASVDLNGKVTALASGTATITVTTEDGNKTATCVITVIDSPCNNLTAAGTFGENNAQTWTLCPDGTLTISGQGAMPNFLYDNIPWLNYQNSITAVVIKDGVTSIGQVAFYNCRHLISVTIPNSVQTIGNMAFADCTSLTSFTIPNSVTTIVGQAFANCNGLITITIPNSVTNIGGGGGPFSFCQNLISINVAADNPIYSSVGGVLFNKDKSCLVQYPCGISDDHYDIPNSVITIYNWAFAGSLNLTSITIPNSVTTINPQAFCYCLGLSSVTIPNSVTTIGVQSFWDCVNLVEFTNLSSTPQTISSTVFQEVNIFRCTLKVPKSTKALYQSAAVWKDFGTIVEQSSTSIPDLITTKTSAYLNDGKLYVNSPVAEKIQIYSTEGTLLSGFQKPAGSVSYPVEELKGSVLIVKGSSGWVKKVVR